MSGAGSIDPEEQNLTDALLARMRESIEKTEADLRSRVRHSIPPPDGGIRIIDRSQDERVQVRVAAVQALTDLAMGAKDEAVRAWAAYQVGLLAGIANTMELDVGMSEALGALAGFTWNAVEDADPSELDIPPGAQS